jgi:uncharacterized protein YjbI with pentapeptide repeats
MTEQETSESVSTLETHSAPALVDKADDLEAIRKAVDDAASVGGALWLSYLFVLFYLAVATGAVTHTDLFFENPVKLPFLNIELPLLAFFFLAPVLFIIMHAYALVHLVMLTEKAKLFHYKNNATDERSENLRWQLPSNIFIQFLAGPADIRGGLFGASLRAIAWITLVIAPILLLLMMQIQFLPFHSSFITWTHRVILFADLGLLWWLWRKILWNEVHGDRTRRPSRAWTVVGLVLSFCVVLFSWTAATFPGEWQDDHWPDWRIFPASDKSGQPIKVSLHDWVFNLPVDDTTRRRDSPFSSTLILPGLNVYEGLRIDDPEKAKWRDFVFQARGRDLKGAILDLASLPKVDFTGAKLQGASFFGAQLQGASLADAQLQGASLDNTKLQGARLFGARLQGAWLPFAQLQGAELNGSQFQGANLGGAQLQGASLNGSQFQGAELGGVQLQGASLNFAQLQGADLSGAQLQGASLNGSQLQGADLGGAQLQGADLSGAQLQGASLQKIQLQAADLSSALLWRSKGDIAIQAAVRLPDSPDQWLPSWEDSDRKVRPWNNEAYQHLRQVMESLPDNPYLRQIIASLSPSALRDQALDRIRRLDCANHDPTLASCDPGPSVLLPPEAARWRKSLEDARVAEPDYTKALGLVLKPLICAGGDDTAHVLHGIVWNGRLVGTGPEAPALIDFILSKDCPVSDSLSHADKALLLRIKQDAIKEPGQ